ncbi:MAG: hypothetical protein ACAH11_15010 [Sphingomonas sp.]
MNASPPESNGTLVAGPATAPSAEAVAAALEEVLASLDELGHGLAGCYVSTAVELIRASDRK